MQLLLDLGGLHLECVACVLMPGVRADTESLCPFMVLRMCVMAVQH